MVVVLSPSSAHMVVPSPSCVSARWVGTNVGWGYSPWHPKLHNNDEWRMSLIVRCLVATSLTVTWHLDAVLERSVVGASELAHLVSLLYVVRRVAPWSFVCRWLPCRRCLLLVWEIERGRVIAHLGVVHLRCHSFAIIASRRRSCVVGCYVACFLWEQINGEGDGHLAGWMWMMTTTCVIIVWTWHVRWRATSCLTQAVETACTHGPLMCRCDVVRVVGVCSSGRGRLNDGCEVVVVVAKVTEGMWSRWWWWLRRKRFVCRWYLFLLFPANAAYAALYKERVA